MQINAKSKELQAVELTAKTTTIRLVGDATTEALRSNGKHAKSVKNRKSGRIATILWTKEMIVACVMDGTVQSTQRLLVQGNILFGCVSLA